MANPFKEAENKKKKAPGSKQEPVGKKEPEVKVETKVEQEVPEEKPAEVVQDTPVEKTAEKPAKKVEKKQEKKEETAAGASKDIFAGLETVKPTGKTYAFYLNDDNVEKLKKKADKLGISTSKLLNHILSEVL